MNQRISTEMDKTPEQMVYTRKELKSMLMPTIGTVIDDKYTVMYVNLGKLRFTSSYKETRPEINSTITIEDKVYEVGYIDDKKNTFTATLKDIIQEQHDIDIPNSNVTKVI